jgi:hypothetical protein
MVVEFLGAGLGVFGTYPVREDIKSSTIEKTDSDLQTQKFLGGLMTIAGLALLPVPGFLPAVVKAAAFWTGVDSWRSANKEQTIREAIQRRGLLGEL